jgi:hypothetical protein
MPPNVDFAEREFIRQAHETALRGDRIQARQFQVALEVLRTTYEMSELLDTNPDRLIPGS